MKALRWRNSLTQQELRKYISACILHKKMILRYTLPLTEDDEEKMVELYIKELSERELNYRAICKSLLSRWL